ncbi:hypothetical protein QK290_17925 [Pseudarthrobacter sp. AL07]|uniref:hypothetical protein n=1 Tax=unclassified Pseudarthrobacter TaxID=2647000 RepID=UPI00249BBBB6|nr:MULTISPECIES: hypothetical protein [unclassified Pseudarthrobacter]MDI3196278.1 hypothetical protein [Pseudarthrobacter sp. AL20]MDI3210334.1 hypothetical protein [Pseudarthrobacter sp. AL07]
MATLPAVMNPDTEGGSDAMRWRTQSGTPIGEFKVETGEESYAELQAEETLVDVETAPNRLIVRCTVKITGPGSGSVHAVGPMNG